MQKHKAVINVNISELIFSVNNIVNNIFYQVLCLFKLFRVKYGNFGYPTRDKIRELLGKKGYTAKCWIVQNISYKMKSLTLQEVQRTIFFTNNNLDQSKLKSSRASPGRPTSYFETRCIIFYRWNKIIFKIVIPS